MTAAADQSSALRVVLDHQHGLATRAQLRDLGVAGYTVKSHIAGGRWRALSQRVIALHTGALTKEQVAWFAVLDGGDGCVLDGLSALHGHGLTGFPVDRVQTAVPVVGRSARHELYVRRRSHRLTPDAVHPARRPPMMRIGAALIGALENNTLPLRGLYVATAGDIEGGAHSLVEIDFRQLARQAGIPAPLGQTIRTDRHGRRRYLDADFDGFGVEVDGAIHLRPLACGTTCSD